MRLHDIEIPEAALADFCRRWAVRELSLFGSILTAEFRPESDVDVLVSFVPEVPRSLSHLVEMQEELTALFGRRADVCVKEGLKNPFRRDHILTHRKVLHVA